SSLSCYPSLSLLLLSGTSLFTLSFICIVFLDIRSLKISLHALHGVWIILMVMLLFPFVRLGCFRWAKVMGFQRHFIYKLIGFVQSRACFFFSFICLCVDGSFF